MQPADNRIFVLNMEPAEAVFVVCEVSGSLQLKNCPICIL